jgi:phosphohistidine swiveling domain-containing protein
MAVMAKPLEPHLAERLTESSRPLGDRLAVRSSGVHEADGTWSGVFSSYLEIRPEEVPQAVVGCWASTFTVAAIDRHLAAGIQPGSMDMAVLIQPELIPDFAGTAGVDDRGITVGAIAGSPAPLVSGWDPGSYGRIDAADEVSGPAVDLIGERWLREIATMLRAAATLGATACEWAVADERLYLLQLLATPRREPMSIQPPEGLNSETARHVSRLARRFPGPLGESLVLPWALGCADIPPNGSPSPIDPLTALHEAAALASGLTAAVWSLPPDEAARVARDTLRELRGNRPQPALERVVALSEPDRAQVSAVLDRLATVREEMTRLGAVVHPESAWHLDPAAIERRLAGTEDQATARIGFDRWDPFHIGVTAAHGTPVQSVPASAGLGFGRARWIDGFADRQVFRPREVIATRHPTPDLAPLLWDAAGVVTTGGNPGAHLFESARSLGLPAVCGVDLAGTLGADTALDGKAVAVDGTTGVISIDEW